MPLVWPASLPQQPLYDGYQEQAPNLVIRSQMDAGPPKIRQRFTAGIRTFAMRLALTKAQVATLDTFFVTTAAGGSIAFEWVHPRTGATVNYRFVVPPQPKYHADADDVWWAELALEILP